MRKLLRPAVLAVGLIAVVALLQGLSRATVAHEASFSYGSHVRQALDAYWNDPDSGTQPGIVIVHGGYWNSGGKADWKDTAEWYASQGFAVFSIDHRFGTEAPWPGPRDDVLAAIDWIKQRASDFRLDPDRIAVIGSQAGGQLAALAGTYGFGNARVRGVIALSPIASPKRAYDEAQTTAATATRRKIRDHTVITADCSPADGNASCVARYDDMTVGKQASSDDAPMLLIHSASDTVPATHASDVKTALAAQGVSDVTVKTVTGSSSGGPLLARPDPDLDQDAQRTPCGSTGSDRRDPAAAGAAQGPQHLRRQRHLLDRRLLDRHRAAAPPSPSAAATNTAPHSSASPPSAPTSSSGYKPTTELIPDCQHTPALGI